MKDPDPALAQAYLVFPLIFATLRQLSLSNFNVSRRLLSCATELTKRPIGTWPKNKVLNMVRLYWRTTLIEGLLAIAMGPLTRGLGGRGSRLRCDLLESGMLTWRLGYTVTCRSILSLRIDNIR